MEIPAAMRAQKAEGVATVLAIGTATPEKCMLQEDYPDYYFRVTKSEHLVDLKHKFKRMCNIMFLVPTPLATCHVYY